MKVNLIGISIALISAIGALAETPELERVAYFGVHATPVTPVLTSQLGLERGVGLVVDVVEADSPAKKAGIQEHDILLKLNDQILIGHTQFSTLVRNSNPGDRVSIEFMRSGDREELEVVLGEREDAALKTATWIDKGDFPMPGARLFKFKEVEGLSDLPKVDPEAVADWSRRLGENVEMVIENVYRGAQHPDFTKMPRVYLKRGDKIIRFEDEGSSFVYVKEDGAKRMVVRGGNGEEIFNGTVENEGDIEKVPEAYRDRAKMLLEMDRKFEAEPTDP